MPSDELFPTTRATWLMDRISDVARVDAPASDGLREAREHVMRRYYEPLAAYLSATSYRDVDAPSALVAGFFVDRLSDDTYLVAWKASGMLLRKWLVNGLLFWVRTEVRRRRRTMEREQAGGAAALALEVSGSAALHAERVFEREWARSIVSDACEVVAERLVAEGLADRWQHFRRHVLDGLSYEEVARESACEAREVRNACRVVRARLESAFVELLRAEGVREGDLGNEVKRIQSHFTHGDEA
jgi:hypothetical protein